MGGEYALIVAHAQERPPDGARLHHRICDECDKVTVQWMTRQRAAEELDGTTTPGVTMWHCSTLSPAAFRKEARS